MKYKKDNKLPNTKNVRRKTNPAGITTLVPQKTTSGSSASTPTMTITESGGQWNMVTKTTMKSIDLKFR